MNKFRTLGEKLEDEIKYNLPDRILTRKEKDKLLEEQHVVYYVPKQKMGFAIAHCIYNEEQHLEECLYDDLRMNDVDLIHILDGAWEKFEDGSIGSTDKTIEIVSKFMVEAKKYDIDVVYENNPKNTLWANQGEKRSYQLDSIKKYYKGKRHYTLVKDGDELFHFLSGRQNIWLKRDFVEWFDKPINIGLLNANSYYGDTNMWGVRLFPSNIPIHYATNRSMVIHDKDHNVVCDYNPETFKVDNSKCFKFADFILINQWTTRPARRINQKKSYIDYRLAERFADKPCDYA